MRISNSGGAEEPNNNSIFNDPIFSLLRQIRVNAFSSLDAPSIVGIPNSKLQATANDLVVLAAVHRLPNGLALLSGKEKLFNRSVS